MVTKQLCSACIHCLFIISSRVQEMTGCHYRTETCRIVPFLSSITSYRRQISYILHAVIRLNNCSKLKILGSQSSHLMWREYFQEYIQLLISKTSLPSTCWTNTSCRSLWVKMRLNFPRVSEVKSVFTFWPIML